MWKIVDKPSLSGKEINELRKEQGDDTLSYIDSIKYVTFEVDEGERTIHLRGHFIRSWNHILRTKIYEKFLQQNPEFFSINDVCHLLKLTRKSVESLIKEGSLRTFSVIIEDEESNVKKTIHKSDLYNCLKEKTTASYNREFTFSGYRDKELEDLFKRKSVEGKEPFYVLEGKNNQKEQDALLKKIVNRELFLESKQTLQEQMQKSDTSMFRLLKCVPTLHFTLTGTKVNTRIIAVNETRDFVHYLQKIVSYISSKPVLVLPIKIKGVYDVPFVLEEDYSRVYDFLKLYYQEGVKNPGAFTLISGWPYLIVTEKDGQYADEYLLMSEKDTKDVKELVAMFSANLVK
ncbi:hypothetical protein ABEP71_19130 [Bacillus velezensis]